MTITNTAPVAKEAKPACGICGETQAVFASDGGGWECMCCMYARTRCDESLPNEVERWIIIDGGKMIPGSWSEYEADDYVSWAEEAGRHVLLKKITLRIADPLGLGEETELTI